MVRQIEVFKEINPSIIQVLFEELLMAKLQTLHEEGALPLRPDSQGKRVDLQLFMLQRKMRFLTQSFAGKVRVNLFLKKF